MVCPRVHFEDNTIRTHVVENRSGAVSFRVFTGLALGAFSILSWQLQSSMALAMVQYKNVFIFLVVFLVQRYLIVRKNK